MIGEYLKKFRSSGYSGKDDKSDDKSGESKEKMDDNPRILALTDDEMQAFKSLTPGQEAACEVHGTLESDGKLHVMSVSPMGGAEDYGSEKEMAGQVAQRVTPSVQLSPS